MNNNYLTISNITNQTTNSISSNSLNTSALQLSIDNSNRNTNSDTLILYHSSESGTIVYRSSSVSQKQVSGTATSKSRIFKVNLNSENDADSDLIKLPGEELVQSAVETTPAQIVNDPGNLRTEYQILQLLHSSQSSQSSASALDLRLQIMSTRNLGGAADETTTISSQNNPSYSENTEKLEVKMYSDRRCHVTRAVELVEMSHEFIDDMPRLTLVMDDIGGASLRSILLDSSDSSELRVSLAQFLSVAYQVTLGLDLIHDQSIIHQDITPDNIILAQPFQKSHYFAQIIDFNCAIYAEKCAFIMPSSSIRGTLPYISPEQTGRINKLIDYRTDFYSLGITLYEILCGQLPFYADDTMGWIHCHIAKKSPPVQSPGRQIPNVVSAIITKLLEKSPDDRYQSAKGLKYDLNRIFDHLKKYMIRTKHSSLRDTEWRISLIHDLSDLEICDALRDMDKFQIGTQDFSNRTLLLSEKLFGRERELYELEYAFNSAILFNRMELLLVKGVAGSGKSRLVQELRPLVIKHNGYFVIGKFDQFSHATPYYGFVEAFKKLFADILGGREHGLASLREKLSKELDPMSFQLLKNVLPSIQYMIETDEQSIESNYIQLNNLQAAEISVLFRSAWVKLIRILASESPIVIFFDDIQWSDNATMKLLHEIIQNSSEVRVLFVAAYRTNEMTSTHALFNIVQEIRKSNGSVKEISVSTLSKQEIISMISHILTKEKEEVSELASLIYDFTSGNPFLIHNYLRELYLKKALWIEPCPDCDDGIGKWKWSMEQIMCMNVGGESAIDWMTSQLKELLPRETFQLIKYAACIGHAFDVATLAHITGKSISLIVSDIWPAVSSGYVVTEGDDLKRLQIAVSSDGASLADSSSKPIVFKFIHDKVQKAALSSFSDEKETQRCNLEIARYLTEKGVGDSELFTLLNHYNSGLSCLDPKEDRDEIKKLALLNLSAAVKVKDSSAYQLAEKYNRHAFDCLYSIATEDELWANDYDSMLLLCKTEAAIAQALLDIKTFWEMSAKLRKYGRDDLDRLCLDVHEIGVLTGQLQYEKALRLAEESVRAYGYGQVFSETNDVSDWFDQNPPSILLERLESWRDGSKPDMSDIRARRAVRCLSSLCSTYYLIHQMDMLDRSICVALKIFLEMGEFDVRLNTILPFYSFRKIPILDSANKIKFFGILNNIRNTYRFDSMYDRLHGDFLHLGICPCDLDAPNMDRLAGECINAAAEIYNFSLLSFAVIVRLNLNLDNGFPMADTFYWVKRYASILSTLPGPMYQTLLKTQQILKTGMTDTRISKQPFVIPAYTIDPSQFQQNQMIMFSGCFIAFLFEDLKSFEFFLKMTLELQSGLEHLLAIYQAYLIIYKPGDQDLESRIKKIDSILKVMESAVAICEAREIHRMYLVRAERECLLNNESAAIMNFEKAIEYAIRYNIRSIHGFANERLAKFLVSRGSHLKRYASLAMTAAVNAYNDWGMKAKVQQLEMGYPELLSIATEVQSARGSASRSTTASIDDNQSPTAIFGTRLLSSSTSTTMENSKTSEVRENPDLVTIFKVTNLLSGEQKLENLLKQLLIHTSMNAGAESAVLLLKGPNEKLYIQGKFNGMANITVLDQVVVDQNTRDILPLSVIKEAERLNRPIIVVDAIDSIYSKDPYIQKNHVRSLLCSPISFKKRQLGFILLENNLNGGVFSEERLEVVKALSTAAGISIENNYLQQLNKELQTALQNSPPIVSSRPQYDLDAPIQKTIESLQGLMNSYPELRGPLTDAIQVIASGNDAFVSNIDNVHDEFGQALDSDTKNWIKESMLQEVRQQKVNRGGSLSLMSVSSKSTGSQELMDVPLPNERALSIMKKYDTFDFNLFDLIQESGSACLSILAYHVTQERGLLQKLRLNPRKVWNYFCAIENAYRRNFYHNSAHAADVMQTALLVLKESPLWEEMSDLETLAVIIASIGHDVDHYGVNNNFLVQTRDPLAVMYSDQAVLEYHHSAKTFELATTEDCNIFSDFTPEQYRELRKYVIGMILATDMSKHFEYVNKLKSRIAGLDATTPVSTDRPQTPKQQQVRMESADKALYFEIAVKTGDLNNPAKPINQAIRWTHAIMQEFYHQGSLERSHGLPVTKFMDKRDPNVPKCQIGFIDIIVSPLFDLWKKYNDSNPLLAEWAQNLAKNRKYWEARLAKGQLDSDDAVEEFYPDLKGKQHVILQINNQ